MSLESGDIVLASEDICWRNTGHSLKCPLVRAANPTLVFSIAIADCTTTTTKMSDNDSSLGADTDPPITHILTPDESLREGLLLAGFSMQKQARQPKSNVRDFNNQCGSKPIVLVCIWEDLQSATLEAARVPPNKLKLECSLMAHHFLKQCPTKSERKAAHQKQSLMIRDNVWCHVEKMRALKAMKTFIPNDHIEGNDIWIPTVDDTMSVANKWARKDTVKGPAIFSFEHHATGCNSEIAISVKESRCMSMSGGHDAGSGVDRVPFGQPGGMQDMLKEHDKKGIADGGNARDDGHLSMFQMAMMPAASESSSPEP